MPNLIPAAKLLLPHGLKGAIKAKLMLEHADHLVGQPLPTGVDGLTLTVSRVQTAAQNKHILHIKEVTSREQAEGLAGVTLYISREMLPQLAEGDVYFADLIGRAVTHADGTVAGTIAAIVENPAHPLLELDGGQLVPLHEAFVENLAATPLVLTELGAQALAVNT
ncbi:MAG: 16S rRNA processing protein RimM [Pseudomonadaceae bacterium]|nr:16S rRNA processing protein RimM [Pseudomonadaceae bacterium]